MRRKTIFALGGIWEIRDGIYSPLIILIIVGGMFVTTATAQNSLQTKILAASQPVADEDVQKKIDELIKQLGDENPAVVRNTAVDALGKIGQPAVQPLIEALEDENVINRRAAAALALSRIASKHTSDPQAVQSLKRAVQPLIKALKDESTNFRQVRQFAAGALGKIGDPRAIQPLINALQDENSRVRGSAAFALGEIGDSRAVQPLINALGDEKSSTVLKSVAQALGKIRDPRTVQLLIETLRDGNYSVRKSAADALGNIGDPQAAPSLINALGDRNLLVRQSAVIALGEIGDPQAVQPLTNALREPQLHRIATLALKRINFSVEQAKAQEEKKKAEAAEEKVKAEVPEAPQTVIVAAAEQPAVDAATQKKIDELQAQLESKNFFAVRALLRKMSIETLIKAMNNEDLDLQRTIANALILRITNYPYVHVPVKGRGLDSQAVKSLIKALRSGDNKVSTAARMTLEKVQDALTIESLIEALEVRDKRARVIIFEILGKRGVEDARVVEPLIEVMIDKNEERYVRQIAAEALGNMKDAWTVEPLPRVVEALIGMMMDKNEDEWLRVIAAKALGNIGDARAIGPLIEVMDLKKDSIIWVGDKFIGVRGFVEGTAKKALEKIEGGSEKLSEELDKIQRIKAKKNSMIRTGLYLLVGIAVVLVTLLKKISRKTLPMILIGLALLLSSFAKKPVLAKEVAPSTLQTVLVTTAEQPAADAATQKKIDELIVQLKRYSSDVIHKNALEALVKIGPPAVQSLIKTLEDEHFNVRRFTAEALGKIGDPRAVQPLLKALRDKNLEVRTTSLLALGQIGDPQAVQPLTKALEDEDEVWNVRVFAAEALGLIGNSRAIQPLIKVLRDEIDVVRQSAAQALGNIGDQQAVQPLIEALGDETPFVRAYVAQALGKIGDPRAVQPLTKTLGDDAGAEGSLSGEYNLSVSQFAATALEQIKSKITPEEWAKAQEQKEQVEAQKDQAKAVETTAQSVADEATQKKIDELIAQLKRFGNDITRKTTLEALVKIGPPAVQSLIKCLGDKNVRIRQFAVEALGKIGDSRAVKPLIIALGDEDERVVRLMVVEALGKIGDPQAVLPLIKVLGDRPTAPEVLQGARGAGTFTTSIKDLVSQHVFVVTEALGQIGDERAVEPLMKLMIDENEDWQIRKWAVEALIKIGDTRLVEMLIEVMRDKNEDEDVREMAIHALGDMGDARAIGPMIEVMNLKNDRAWIGNKFVGGPGSVSMTAKIVVKEIDGGSEKLNEEIDKIIRVKQKEALKINVIFRIGAYLLLGIAIAVAALVKLPRRLRSGKYYEEDLYSSEDTFSEIDELPTARSLITDLGNEDPLVREKVAVNLGRTGDKHAIKPLAKALKDQDQTVRKAAKESLIQVLIKTLDDEDPRSRAMAAKALGQIGDKRSINHLIKTLKDEDQTVRTAAGQALALIKKKLGPEEWSKIVQKRA